MKVRVASALVLSTAAAIGGVMLFTSSAASPALAAPQASGAFKVDPVHSSMIFKLKHNNTAWFYGRFNNPTGTFNIDLADPSKSSFDVTVKADDVDTANAQRDKHLKSGDFFSAKEYPTIAFKGKSFKKSGEHAVEATGELTIRGVTKPVTVTIEHTGDGKDREGKTLMGVHTTFTIKRSDFGITYGTGALGDDVTIMVGLEGSR
jgi:polyisoprenoid-binding protein YceI